MLAVRLVLQVAWRRRERETQLSALKVITCTSAQLWLTATTFCNAHVVLPFTKGHYNYGRTVKAGYEKVRTAAADRCQVANGPTKTKPEQMPSALALLEQQEGMEAAAAATAISERQKPLPGPDAAQADLYPPVLLFSPPRAAKIKRTHNICAALKTLALHFHQIISAAASERPSKTNLCFPKRIREKTNGFIPRKAPCSIADI